MKTIIEFYASAYAKLRNGIVIGRELAPGWIVAHNRPTMKLRHKTKNAKMEIKFTMKDDLHKVTVSGQGSIKKEEYLQVLRIYYTHPEIHVKETKPFCVFRFSVPIEQGNEVIHGIPVTDFDSFQKDYIINKFAGLPDFGGFYKRDQQLFCVSTAGKFIPLGSFIGTCPGLEKVGEFNEWRDGMISRNLGQVNNN